MSEIDESMIDTRQANKDKRLSSINVKKGTGSFKKGTINGFRIPPYYAGGSLTEKKVERIIEAINASKKPLTKNEFLAIAGPGSVDEKWEWFQEFADTNYDNGILNYNREVYAHGTSDGYDKAAFERVSAEFEAQNQGEEPYDPQANFFDLMTDTQGEQAQQYKHDMMQSIGQQEAEVDESMMGLELDAYKMIGQQQQQLERQIADQRMRALGSGVTSAQLASQQLANMFSASSAAGEVSGQVMQQRMGNRQQFAQQRGSVVPSLYDMVNQNKGTLANVEAQRFAAQKGFESYDQASTANRLANMGPQAQDYYKQLLGGK